MNAKGLSLAAAGVGFVVTFPRFSQAQDTAATQLKPVVVEVGRGAHQSPLDLPFAVTVQTPDSSRPGQRHLALDETLWLIPGLTVSNRNNPSQDPRISIRGFGARSASGASECCEMESRSRCPTGRHRWTISISSRSAASRSCAAARPRFTATQAAGSWT